MPGLTLRFGPDNPSDGTTGVLSGLSETRHFPDYTSRILYRADRALLTFTGYPAYPIEQITAGRMVFFIEGRLYGALPADFARELGRILTVEDLPARLRKLREWLPVRSGDFVAVGRDNTSGRWHLLNDARGRLPLYVTSSGESVLYSREISVAISHAENRTFDRTAGRQFLLFGFSLGNRTPVSGVERLPGATYACYDPRTGTHFREVVHTLDLSTHDTDTAADGREVGKRLAERFVESCRLMAPDHGAVTLGLSGGHDSRAVAAGLAAASIPVKAYTWVGWRGEDSLETRSARAVANALHVSWETVPTNPPTLADAASVIRLKSGLLYTGLSFADSYLGSLADRHGRGQTYFTGDGGDKLIPCLRPTKKLDSVESLVRFLTTREATCDLSRVARLTRMPEAELLQDIANVVSGYPERDFRDRFVHFQICERAMNWSFEGEDRNRCYFWSCSPFYHLPFFREAMAAPASLKRHHRLYRWFLESLSPAMTTIPDASRGLAIDRRAYYLRMLALSMLQKYPRLMAAVKKALRRKMRGTATDPSILAVLMSVRENRQRIGELIDIDYYLREEADGRPWDWVTQHNVLTIVSQSERLMFGDQTLDQFGQESFRG